MRKIEINSLIVADPKVCHGKPTFKNTRIMIWQILEILSAGGRKEDVLKAFPNLSDKHILAALDYASSLTKEGYIVLNLNA